MKLHESNYSDVTDSSLGAGKPKKTLAQWRGTKLISEKYGWLAFHQPFICGLQVASVTYLGIENTADI